VASRTGGLGESVEDGVSGLLFPNGDEDALSSALTRVATEGLFPSRSLAPAVVARAVQTFDVTRHVAVLRAHLQGLATHAGG
jgi:glycosyltransferase involved in cell wall biosynthesis